MGTSSEKSKITTYFVEHYIKNPLKEVDKKAEYVDGPLNTVHLDFGSVSLFNQGIAKILLNGIAQIPKKEYYVCERWIQERLAVYSTVPRKTRGKSFGR